METWEAGDASRDADARREHWLLQLVDQHGDAAYRTAYRLLRDRNDAHDAVQDALTTAFRRWDELRSEDAARGWFFRILVNCVYSRHRKTRRHGVAVELEDSPELYLYCQTAAAGLHGMSEDPANALMSRLDEEAIREAVDALPTEYRVVATLYFMQDLQY